MNLNVKRRGVTLSFDDLGLNPDILKGLADVSIEEPTSLHKKVLPVALQGNHLLVEDESTDETAFLIPVLQKLTANGEVEGTRILILTPSAERAKKLDEVIWALGYHAQISSASVSIRGNRKEQEEIVQSGAPVIVANPGQLSDILSKTGIRFNSLTALVIDQADKMNRYNLVNKVKSVFEKLDCSPQCMVFAAKMNNAVHDLHSLIPQSPIYIGFSEENFIKAAVKAGKNEAPVRNGNGVKHEPLAKENALSPAKPEYTPAPENPEEVLKKAGVKVVLKKDLEKDDAAEKSDPKPLTKKLTQGYINVPPRMKISTLMAHLEDTLKNSAVVFTASKKTADRLFRIILKKNWGVVSIHDGLDKETFDARFKKFLDGEMKVLIVGGMSAVNLDLTKTEQVINYDVPVEVDEYRYRAELIKNGKTAQIISLVSGMDREDIDRIVREAGYPPVEMNLPVEVKEKKPKPASKANKKKDGGPNKPAKRGKNEKHDRKKPRGSKTGHKKTKLAKRELPRPSYEGLSGGRDGKASGGLIGWVKKLFS